MIKLLKWQHVPWLTGAAIVALIGLWMMFSIMKNVQADVAFPTFLEARKTAKRPSIIVPKAFPKEGTTTISGTTAKGVALKLEVTQRQTGCDLKLFKVQGLSEFIHLISTGTDNAEPQIPCSPQALSRLIKSLVDPELVNLPDFANWLEYAAKMALLMTPG